MVGLRLRLTTYLQPPTAGGVPAKAAESVPPASHEDRSETR